MGVNGSSRRNPVPRRAYYPSGPWIDGIRPPGYPPAGSATAKEEPRRPKLPNPDPANYRIVRAHEERGFLLIELHYPDCANYEGRKVLLYRGVSLIRLVNQKVIDPHFFQHDTLAAPVARFVPSGEGWGMALKLIAALAPVESGEQ